jgi:hypothetical protein
LSNSITPYHQKLLKLKKVPGKYGSTYFLLKNQLRQGFFSVITVLLLLVIVFMSFMARLDIAKTQIVENNSFLNLKIKSLIDLTEIDRQNVFKSIKVTLQESIRPLTGFTNTEWLLDKDFDKIEVLTDSWLAALDPLMEYSFTSEGFIHRSNPDKVFTQDLEVFFDILPRLQSETEKLWGEMWVYRLLINSSNQEKAKSSLERAEVFISNISSIFKIKPLILKILGHYSTQRMVIFNQNVGEARPTGGFIGSYIPLDITQGKIKMGESQSIYYIDGQSKSGVISHPAVWYSNKDENINNFAGVRNLNMLSCFPDTAKTIENEFSNSGNGYTIDQLLMINPQMIQSILPDDFTFNVSGIGNITKNNFLDEVERLSSFGAPDKSNPKSLVGPIFEALLIKIPEIVKSVGLGDIITKIFKSLKSRDINLWFRDVELQQVSSRLGFASEQVCAKSKNSLIITPLIANISGDKRGLISENNFSLQAKSEWGGTTFYVTFIQNLPESKNLQRVFNTISTFNMIALQIPQNAFNIKISSDNIINLPYLRENYVKNVTQENTKSVIIPTNIQTTIQTGRDLEKGGFTYNQADGSLVAGAYISDNSVGETKVNFEFTLPLGSEERIDFFGQPGLNQPSLFIGEGLDVYKNQHIRHISNPQTIQSGVTLITK